MCDMAGLQVTALKRVRIGPVRLGGLRTGQWSELPASLTRELWMEGLGKRADARSREHGTAGDDDARAAGGPPRVAARPEKVARSGRVVNEVIF